MAKIIIKQNGMGATVFSVLDSKEILVTSGDLESRDAAYKAIEALKSIWADATSNIVDQTPEGKHAKQKPSSPKKGKKKPAKKAKAVAIPSPEQPKKGRPSDYRDEYAEQAYKLCLLGNMNDAQIAEFFDVAESTINLWKLKHPAFSESIREGKKLADINVAQSLYHRAMGYSHGEEKIFCSEGVVVRAQTTKHYPPDPMAMMFWLKNRRPDLWRDKQTVEVEGLSGMVDALQKGRERLNSFRAQAEATATAAAMAQPSMTKQDKPQYGDD